MRQNTQELQAKILVSLAVIVLIAARLFSDILEAAYNPDHFLTIHTILEILSICVSLTIPFLGWVFYSVSKHKRSIRIGAAFLAIGLLDMAHTISFSGMPFRLPEAAAVWFWIIARLTEGISLFLIFRLDSLPAENHKPHTLYLIAFAYSAAVIYCVFAFLPQLAELLPSGEQQQTPLEIIFQVTVAICHLGVFYTLLAQYFQTRQASLLSLIVAAVILFSGEVLFTFYKQVNDVYAFLGHIYKTMGYYFLLQGVYLSTIRDYLHTVKQAESVLGVKLEKVTQEKNLALKAHKELLEMQHLLYENMTQGVVYHDQSGAVILANPAAEKILGFTTEQMSGKSSLHPNWKAFKEDGTEFPGQDQPAMVALQTGAGVRDVIMGVLPPDGQECRWIKASSIPIFRAGESRPYRVFSTFEDITEIRRSELEAVRIEARLLRAEQSALLGTVAASIAHEINQPLSSIKFAADASLYWYRNNNPPKQEDIMQSFSIITSQADRIDSIIKNIRSVIQHGKLDQQRKSLNLNTIVGQALSELSQQFAEKQITLITNYCTIPNVCGTAAQIEEIIYNLLLNAMHALETKHDGERKLTVSTHFDQQVILEISDNGPGIAPEIADRIFEPFFTTRNGEGLGLGLAISQRIARLFNGDLILVPTQQGATFQLLLAICNEVDTHENTAC